MLTLHYSEKELRQRGKKALLAALGLATVFMFVEFLGGLFLGSLVLLADAAHMLTDGLALSFALVAFWVAERPPTQRMSYGFHRAEILAALGNGIILVNVVIFIFIEAFRRLFHPRPIEGGFLFLFAVAGLVVNGLCIKILSESRKSSLNVQGAFFHVLSDFLGSIAVLTAALLIRFGGWHQADPIASFAVGGLIVFCAWKLLKDSCSILLEASPKYVDLDLLESNLLSIEGVKDVHDLHVWTISNGRDALSAHLAVEPLSDTTKILLSISEILEKRFGISHSTIQLETVHHSKASEPSF